MKLTFSVIGTLLAIVVSVGGIIWAAEDRYVDEKEAVQTIRQMQSVLDKRMSSLERKNLMQEYVFLTEQYYIFKDRTMIYAGDEEIIREFERIKIRREAIKEELGL